MNEPFGILVGSNARQEWLLSWWWENYRRHNNDPVSFVDFGLSAEKKEWCKERGRLISLRMPPLFVKDRDEVDTALVEEWESRFPDLFGNLEKPGSKSLRLAFNRLTRRRSGSTLTARSSSPWMAS